MIRRDDALAVQKNLVAAYFVGPLPLTVSDDQHTAACRHLVKVELVGLGTWCIGSTGQEGMHVNTWRITSKPLRLFALFLRPNRSGDQGTK